MSPPEKPAAWRRAIFFSVVGLHVMLILLTSFEVQPHQIFGRSVSSALGYYGFVSGSANHYGFFAPGVVSQLRARYQARDETGRLVGKGNVNQGNLETSFRFHNMIENFWVEEDEDRLRKAYAASWVSRIFAKHPDAVQVNLTVDSLVLPSSRRYRDGERPSWENHYTAKFFRNAAHASGKTSH